MKRLYFLSTLILSGFYSCSQDTKTDLMSKAGLSFNNETVILASDAKLSEDILLGQLPATIVKKIDKDRKLRYMQLTNIIKKNIEDSVIYDLTFESYSKEITKSVKFDQNGNKFYVNLNVNDYEKDNINIIP